MVPSELYVIVAEDIYHIGMVKKDASNVLMVMLFLYIYFECQ